MAAKRLLLGLVVFFLLSAAWAQKTTSIDPLLYLTKFETIPTEEGVLNLIIHRGTGEVVLHVLNEELRKVHEDLYNTTASIHDYIVKVKNGKVYILLSWLSNHSYKKEVLEYSLKEKHLNVYHLGGTQILSPTDFLVFEENFAIVGAQQNTLVQVYKFNPFHPLPLTVSLPGKQIWQVNDIDDSINFLTSPKGNHQILEWQQYSSSGELVGQLKLDLNTRNKDITSATLLLDAYNNPRVIGTTGEKKHNRYSAFFHWTMDNQNIQSFSIIEPQSLAESNNGLSRKQRRQLNYERKKGFRQVEILTGLDGELLVSSIPGRPISQPETIFKKQMVHFLHLDNYGNVIWDKLVDFDFTTRRSLNDINYRRETFSYFLGDNFYFGHKDNSDKEDQQFIHLIHIDQDGQTTTFNQELPPGIIYRVKHLSANEVLLYNEAPLFQSGDPNLQYYMGRFKIQEPLIGLTNKN